MRRLHRSCKCFQADSQADSKSTLQCDICGQIPVLDSCSLVTHSYAEVLLMQAKQDTPQSFVIWQHQIAGPDLSISLLLCLPILDIV